ncbi:MAG: sugar ABC transporter ATP-binding protein [Spirochaetaceae bacterium]|jgi:ribose transport system ATP-binding protein|nr:sugar ABC transporter ATP-binding protein [Spirochaetaceae bacterium]
MDTSVFLSVKDVSKQYGQVTVLDKFTADFHRGEVHALVGENGAGKSTICKAIAGAIRPTSGTFVVDGKALSGWTPQEAKKAGVSMVYQEFNLIPEMPVYENLFVGKEIHKSLFVDKKAMIAESRRIFAEMGVSINAHAKLKTLSVAYCQLVEIAKALLDNSKLLILDEPTATLTNNEVGILFNVLGKLKDSGISLIYISHRLEEIFTLCDTITVLRDGLLIKTMPVPETTIEQLIHMMIGREMSQEFPPRVESGMPRDEPSPLRVEGVTNKKLKNISFTLKKGEILGLAGLVGAGRTETVRAVFGADKIDAGKIFVKGKEVRFRSPSDAIREGLALIPEDRKRDGLMLILSIMHNISVVVIKNLSVFTIVSGTKEKEITERSRQLLAIKAASMTNLARSLSGGNQQKIVLAKWLASDADIFIFDEPTRGIDVGAKKEIYDFLVKLKVEGKSLIVISSEMQEILGLCDRIVVMHEGEVQGELDWKEATQEKILSLASGIT